MPTDTGQPGWRVDVRRTLTRNTAWNYTGFAVNLLTNLLLFPYVVREIGDSAAGIWLLLGSVTGYMGLLELGLVPALSQSVAVCRARGDTAGLNRSASTAITLLTLLAAIPLMLVAAVPWMVEALRVPPALTGQARAVFAIAIAGFAARMPLAAFQAVLLGTQRQDRTNQLWILIVLAKFVLAVLLLWLGFRLVAIVTMEALVHLAAGLLQYRWIRQEVPGLAVRVGALDRPEARALVGFGSSLLVGSLCSLLIEQSDKIVISAFLPISMVTYYAAAWKLYAFAYTLPTTLVQAVAPLAGDLHGRGDREKLRQLYLRMTKYTVAVAWPLVLSLGFCGALVLDVWMGPEFARHAAILQVLLVAFAVTSHNHVGYSVLLGMRRIAPIIWWYKVPQALLNVALSVWLVTELGILGVALGTMIPAVALEFVWLHLVKRELSVGWGAFAREVVVPAAAPAAVAFAPLALAYWRIDHRSALLLVAAAACSLLYAVLFWTRSLSKAERAELLAHVPQRHRIPFLTTSP
ncbi:MAG TPA: oligosaccharide flippase family protein [Vicinamibacterales bacterium]|nr:oligosaccharide flippase family protein [Vicinamibacterales bacterium]HPW20720.1 oligosaccharide flippase family protein [Vicinamibacterales bacterium]